MPLENFSEMVNFIWSVANLLRGPYRPNQYKDVMLPMTILRRLDCVLEPTKEKVLQKLKSLASSKIKNVEPILNKVAGQQFHNTSPFTFEKLRDDPDNIAANLTHYIKHFSGRAREIIERFEFEDQIAKLEQHDLLYLLVSKFCEIDLHPERVLNIEMGYIFEELIRRFNEASNEEAGDHFTPRDVIRHMVDLLFFPDTEVLTTKGIVRTLYDPACGTGGMLSVSEDYMRELNPNARLEMFGQDYNPQAYAICGSDMMIKGQSLENIRFGDTFKQDHFKDKKFDYMLANPPFGVEWKPQADYIKREHEEQEFGGRFGAGLPHVTDGALLFLQHMISKMKDSKTGGTRLAIVFNASPMLVGGAGSGLSEIRRWIIENDWLEAIVALPDRLFYNTGINTYIWIVTNCKELNRRGKVQLIDATSFFINMRRNLGEKGHEIGDDQRDTITRLYGGFRNGKNVRILDNEDLGYRRIRVERPHRLNFAISDARIQRLQESKQFIGLSSSKKRKKHKAARAEIEEGRKTQETILEVLESMKEGRIYKNRDRFTKQVKKAFELSGIHLSPSFFERLIDALSQRDEKADICKDSIGRPLPDPDLRDYENVPLKEDVGEYMIKEVLPYATDAWIDDSWTRIGYEIHFSRYFFKHDSLRKLEEIESDLKSTEIELAEMVRELTE